MLQIVRDATDPKAAENKAAAVKIEPFIKVAVEDQIDDDYTLEYLLLLAA